VKEINLLLVGLFLTISIFSTLLLSEKHRWKALLASSITFLFLLIGIKFIVILCLIRITYIAGFSVSKKTYFLAIPIAILTAALFIGKLTESGGHFENYGNQSLNTTWNLSFIELFNILGLSYLTFNSIGYLMDIRRGYLPPQKNFFLLLLYLIYFPTVFSGPLHRAKHMFGQFDKIKITEQSFSSGMRLILWGVFKNTVIAQRLYLLIKALQETAIDGFYYLLIGLLFFLYLYCNFSSFIDFFQGVSQILNIQLKNNFSNRVYLANSRQAFWKGWHITLNAWFRDYFFFVIAKKDRKGKFTDIFLLLTFLLIALWHELSLTLLIWGIFNGLWIVLEKKVNFKKWKWLSIRNILGVIYHLFISSLLALIFISTDLGNLYNHLASTPHFPLQFFSTKLPSIILTMICFLIMDFYYQKAGNKRFDDYLSNKPILLRWLVYFTLSLLILIFGISPGVENYYIQF